MKLYSIDENPVTTPLHTWRHSPLPGVVGLVVIVGLAALVAWAALTDRAPAFIWVIVALLAFMALFIFGTVRASYSSSNWLMRFDGSQVAVKFRSYLNRHFPREDAVVAVFDANEFRGARKTTQRWQLPSDNRGGNKNQVFAYLDLILKEPAAAAELREALRREREYMPPKGSGSRRRFHHSPARIVEPDIVRLMWSSEKDVIRPKIDHALRALGSAIPIEGEGHAPDRKWNDAPVEEVDAMLLELIESGHTMEAKKIARLRYGYSLKEVRQHLEKLEAGQPVSGGEASQSSHAPPEA